ncbi:MAG: HNH endonuclease, partial [[Mycobacterium] stephanolepidis]
MKALAVLVAVALPLTGVQLPASTPAPSAAEQFGLAATTAFQNSANGLDTSLTSAERSAGLPVNPAAGLVSQSPAGAVEMALPANLGGGQLTRAGQMVYPDQGAGFDLLAENTRDGYRTV